MVHKLRGPYKGNNILDWRSTGRKRGRRALYEIRRQFVCVGVEALDISCSKTTKRKPTDAPDWFEELWPKKNRVLTQLQVDHLNKDFTDNDPSNLVWRCPSCHRLADNMTGVGESQIDDGGWTGWD
jgi:hypothetical protein